MQYFFRWLLFILLIVFVWQGVASLLPAYIFPGLGKVWLAWYQHYPLILQNTKITLIETALGFVFGGLVGVLAALLLAWFKPLRYYFLPVLLISQALPTFAIAPLFVVWFGYGQLSKVVTCMVLLFFPVTSAFYDGLKSTPQQYLDLACVTKSSSWKTLWKIKIPAALPNLASGLRLAAVYAPMGAIVGEWVGSSSGLGFLLLNANARVQIDQMFAVLIMVIVMTLLFYFIVDKVLRKIIFWKV